MHTLDIVCGTTHLRRREADRLIASLDRNARSDWRLWLADVSPKPEPLYVRDHPRVRVVREWPRFGISQGYNDLAQLGLAEYVAWLNDDMEVESLWDITAIEALKADPGAGMVASYSLDPRAIGWRVNEFPRGLLYANIGILPRKTFERIGGFDPRVQTYGCDNALAMRVQNGSADPKNPGEGQYVLPVPGSRVVHHYRDDEARRRYMNRQEAAQRPGDWTDVFHEWHPHLERLKAVQAGAPEWEPMLPVELGESYFERFGMPQEMEA